jgi:small redox-active disulfide protein 2
MEIRVIGQDCARCRTTFEEARRAIELAGVPASLVKVDDLRELIPHRALSIPAVVLDGVLKSTGRVPRAHEIARWLAEASRPEDGGGAIQEPPGPDPEVARGAQVLRDTLGLSPVAVFLVRPDQDRTPFQPWSRLESHRYCQAIMRARHGEAVTLEPEQVACPAAARALGFRPLPTKLESGDGLVGFGIVTQPETGRTMFADMPRLDPGSISLVAASPLELAPRLPEAVVVEGEPEALMWLLLADLNVGGGTRRVGETAVLQAACVDATILPVLQGRLNFSLGCYGCREATDMAPGEAIVGFPGTLLAPLCATVEKLATRAMPVSRSKRAFNHLVSRAGSGAT